MVLHHALPNAIGPIANAIAFSLSFLLGGVIIVETIFNYPGIAKLMVDGVANRRACLVEAVDGAQVTTQEGAGRAGLEC